MKNFVLFFNGDYKYSFGNDAFFLIPEFVKNGFLDFFSLFEDNNVNINICRGYDSYLGNDEFKYYFRYNKLNKDFEFINENIKPDFIFNRSKNNFSESFNKFELIDFCRNKLNIINLFPELTPKTYLINKQSDLESKLLNFNTSEFKVLKPIDGSFGDNVLITKDISLIKNYNIFPCILQEFLDTSVGIPGVYKGIHDLRVIIVNGKIEFSMYRIPPIGKLVSNTAKGGKGLTLELGYLSEDLKKIVRKIDDSLRNISPRFYSIDFGYTSNGLKIFELNSSPAIGRHINGRFNLHKALYDLVINHI